VAAGSARPQRGPFWTVLLLLTLAGGWRFAILMRTGFAIDGDEGTLGLMAMHIAQLREAPVWFYGQPYTGALEAYLVALPMALFGASALTLKLTGLVVSVVSVLLGWLLARRTLGPVAGLVAGLYLALPPLTFGIWSLKTSGGRLLLFALGLAILLCAQSIGARGASRRNSIALGLLVGLGIWLNLLLFPFIAAAGLLLLSRRELLTRPRLILYSLAACLVGAAPLIVDNLASGGETFRFIFNRPGGASGRVSNLFLMQPYKLLGIMLPWSKAGDVPAWGVVALLAFVAGAAWVLWDQRDNLLRFLRFSGRRTSGAELFVLLPVVFFAVALIMSGYGGKPSPRFVSVVYPSVAAVFGALAARGWRRPSPATRALTALAVLLLLGFNVGSSWPHLAAAGEAFRADPNGALRQSGTAEPCLSMLRDEGVDGLAGPHWQSHALCFLSGDELVPSPARYGPHQQRFRQARQIAWASSEDDADGRAIMPILDGLARAGVLADERRVSGMRFAILRDTGYPAASWSADSNSSPDKAGRAIDRDPRTGWLAFERPPDAVAPPSLGVDFGSARRIGRLGFVFSAVHGAPRRVGLRTSLDGERWSPYVVLAPDGLTWSTPIAPVMARYVQLQVASSEDMRWRLSELFVFPPADR